MVATFETAKDTAGKVRFRRTAANGEIIADSAAYDGQQRYGVVKKTRPEQSLWN